MGSGHVGAINSYLREDWVTQKQQKELAEFLNLLCWCV